MIFFETAHQARAFLLLLYAGFLSAAAYDLFAAVGCRASRLVRAPLDVLWCLIVGAACALALAVGGEKQARLYALLGLCCGAGIYMLGARRLLAALLRGAFKKKK